MSDKKIYKKAYIAEFICPECGHDTILEYAMVTAVSPLTGFTIYSEEEISPEFDKEWIEDWQNADRIDYMCAECGYILPRDDKELFDWLKGRGMVKETED